MRNYVILTVLLIAVSLNAQTKSDSLVMGKSFVVQSVDTVQNERIERLEQNITDFYHESRQSQAFVMAGSALIIIGNLMGNNSSDFSAILLTLAGLGCNVLGVILDLDSYGHLNILKIKKQKPAKKKIKYTIDDDDYF